MIECIMNNGRTREQIKNKFRKEERGNQAEVDAALNSKMTLNEFFEKHGGKLPAEDI